MIKKLVVFVMIEINFLKINLICIKCKSFKYNLCFGFLKITEIDSILKKNLKIKKE
jgi:hypothetical protein